MALVIARKNGETVKIGEALVTVRIEGNTVKLVIEAPREVRVNRVVDRPQLST